MRKGKKNKKSSDTEHDFTGSIFWFSKAHKVSIFKVKKQTSVQHELKSNLLLLWSKTEHNVVLLHPHWGGRVLKK